MSQLGSTPPPLTASWLSDSYGVDSPAALTSETGPPSTPDGHDEVDDGDIDDDVELSVNDRHDASGGGDPFRPPSHPMLSSSLSPSS
jgi:hypothetical protein